MNDFVAKSRLTRALIFVAALAVIFYALGNAEGFKRVAAAIATALFAWIATSELEVFKTKLSSQNKQFDWKRDLLTKADSCLFDLKVVLEDATTSLPFRPAGESEEQWHARAAECWTESVTTMNNVRRELWTLRSTIENYEDLDSAIQNASRSIRGVILIHTDLMLRREGAKITDLIEKQKELKTLMTALDTRFRQEVVNALTGNTASKAPSVGA
jgi:hypothetical protein